MVIDLDAGQIELDAPLFYISIPFPEPADMELVFTIRRCAPVSPFSVWPQTPPKLTEVFFHFQTHAAAVSLGYLLFIDY